jgi:carbon monoxide dehydrogenase subunit G
LDRDDQTIERNAETVIPIREQLEVAASPSRVWPLLADPAFVVTCVPGAALTAQKGPDLYDGTIAVRFGPITAHFRGEATVKYDHAAQSCKIDARGRDQRGSSGAKAFAHVTVTGTQTTLIAIDGGFDVSGPLGQFARTGGVHLARELLAQFASNLSGKLAAASPGAAAATGPEPASSIGASLFWRAFTGWLRDLFGRFLGQHRS